MIFSAKAMFVVRRSRALARATRGLASTAGQPITCKAAVARGVNDLRVEQARPRRTNWICENGNLIHLTDKDPASPSGLR